MCLKTFKNLIRLYPWLSTEQGPIRFLQDGAHGSVPASGTNSPRRTRPPPPPGCLPACALSVSSPSCRFCKAGCKSGLWLCTGTSRCDLVLCLLSSLLLPFSFPLYFLMLFTAFLATEQHSDLSVSQLIYPNDFSYPGFLSTRVNLCFSKQEL